MPSTANRATEDQSDERHRSYRLVNHGRRFSVHNGGAKSFEQAGLTELSMQCGTLVG